MVFIFYLEWLPGPGTWVHVQQPGIFEQLQEKEQGQESGLSGAPTHTTAVSHCYVYLHVSIYCVTDCRLKAVLPKSSAIHIQLCLRL